MSKTPYLSGTSYLSKYKTSDIDPVESPGFGDPTMWINHKTGKVWKWSMDSSSWLTDSTTGGDSMMVDVYADDSVSGDGATDDTTAINSLIVANPGKILYFRKASYLANITIPSGNDISLVGEPGAKVFWSSSVSPAITITDSNVSLSNMIFDNENATGVGISSNLSGKTIIAENCKFRGHTHRTSGTSNTDICLYTNCTFEIHTATGGNIGTECWSAFAEYRDCIFTGDLGADVQDSKFYNCVFGENEGNTVWAIHMPLGTIDDGGGATDYSGNAEFFNCIMYSGDGASSDTYAIGLGNSAHPKLVNCVVIGNAYGLYVRSNSTVDSENSYYRAKKTSAGAASVGFFKYDPGSWPTGGDGTGDSTLNGDTIVAGEYSLLVPEDTGLGSLSINGVTMEWSKIVSVDTGGTPGAHNDAFNYISDVTVTGESIFESVSVTAGDQVIAPPYTPSGVMFIEAQSSVAGERNIRLTRFYRSPTGFYKNGTIMILRGTSDTNKVRLKNGYWAATGTLVELAAKNDILLGNGDVVTLIYYTNTWKEITNFNMREAIEINGSQIIHKFPLVFTASASIPSPATYSLYLDDGTNHGLGGVPTLMFHNGVGWNALF